ncbi:DUF3891 family protein [Alkalibacillus aidingensis]|uniref:DUF3891 family protein n=1 Tax=Alkalibacillus aidingensis TaxID=2747607 RepID=UPI001660664D|nr:DUF3891 family protein [Alkalibacillus aidingensis]
MIVSEHHNDFEMVKQHDHAIISGEAAKHWKAELFIGDFLRREVEYAIKNHDCAWIPLDQSPIWNSKKNAPHSFMDYPLIPKIEHYSQGIDQVEEQSEYAVILCSQHYLSFFDKDSTDSTISMFISREIERQRRIKELMSTQVPERITRFHFHLLQFCDDLSLYLCLNKPGVPKEQEHPMFKNGFRQEFPGIDNRIEARWLDEQTISVNPNPFIEVFTVQIPYKTVRKDLIQEQGLSQAYQIAPEKHREVTIK